MHTADAPPTGAAGCASCPRLAAPAPPPSERIVATRGWVVAHSFNANLEGWLVVIAARHVESLDELDAAEADELGGLLRALTAALRAVVGCEKTYVLLLAESEGFHHVHVHVVPRGADLAEEARGPRIFTLLNNPALDVVAPERRDELALAIRAELERSGFAGAT